MNASSKKQTASEKYLAHLSLCDSCAAANNACGTPSKQCQAGMDLFSTWRLAVHQYHKDRDENRAA